MAVFSAVPILQRTHAHVPLEVFSKERSTGEVQGIGNLLNVKLLKLYLAIENTLYLCIKDKINNEKSYRLYSCFY